MAFGVTVLDSGSNTAGATSYATASVSPSANALILAICFSTRGSSPPQPTCTGNGLTWVATTTGVGFDSVATPTCVLTVFRALGASPSSGAITFDFGASSQTGVLWIIVQVTGVDTSGTDGSGAVLQPTTNNGNTSTTESVTLGAFGSANNATLMVGAANSNVTITPKAGYTALPGSTVTMTNPSSALQAAWINSNDTSPNMTTAANRNWGALALELVLAAAGGGSDVFFEQGSRIELGIKPWTAAGLGGVLIE